jgi:arginase
VGNSSELTVYQGPAGDHNNHAMAAVRTLGNAMANQLEILPTLIGEPKSARPAPWEVELTRARMSLHQMAKQIDAVLTAGQRPLSAITRCAVALATVPVVLRHHPDTVVVWLDAHGDINTPQSTETGYLGGMALSGAMGWWDSGLGAGLPEQQAILVGVRDLDLGEVEAINSGRVTLVPPGAQLGERLLDAIGARPIYFHLDCDVLEPGWLATDYSVPNGLTLEDLHSCADAAAHSDVVGIEVGEYEGDAEAAVGDLVAALAPLLDS